MLQAVLGRFLPNYTHCILLASHLTTHHITILLPWDCYGCANFALLLSYFYPNSNRATARYFKMINVMYGC